jgi:hypothetical protein
VVYISAFADYYLLKNTTLFKICSEKASQLDTSGGCFLGDEELKEAAQKLGSPHSVQMPEAISEQNKSLRRDNAEVKKSRN